MFVRKLVLATAALTTGAVVAVGDEYKLAEDPSNPRTFIVEVQLEVDGRLETAAGDEKAIALKLDVTAEHRYAERRLPAAGREAASLRAVRRYTQAQAEIEVSQQKTLSELSDGSRLIVARGRASGIESYCPDRILTATEIDLLQYPGDSLAAAALLPDEPVAVGGSWSPERWVLQMLAGLEAVANGELTCRLASVEDSRARIEFTGEVEGATAGAATTVTLEGMLAYDLARQAISRCELTQTEKRSVGPVSPGMDVTATVTWKRTPADASLSDELVARLTPEPLPAALQLRLPTPWRASVRHDRDWRLFHQNQQVAILRLLDRGSLIAQCNISPVPAAAAGEYTPAKEFAEDVQQTLGERLQSLAEPRTIPHDDAQHVTRIVAEGEANGRAMTWIYYLCTHASGRQLAFVFAVETELLDRFGEHDLKLVDALRFSAAPRGR